MGVIVDNPRRQQIQANIEKLLEQARNFESVGFRNLYDYVDELNFISTQSSKESEAIILSGQDAVNIMTIHASKGLEFPVVILYDTNSNSGGNKGIVINKDLGFGFSLPKKIDDVYNTTVNTPISYLIKSESDVAERAEEKRVLYVAMTRAKDILAISANLKMGVKDKFIGIGGLFKLIINSLGIDIDEIYQKNTFELFDRLKILNDNKISDLEYHFNVNVINENLTESFLNIDRIVKISEKLILTDNSETVHFPELFSPSKLMTYTQNPGEYMSKYILSLKDEEEYEHEPEKINDENEPSTSGSEAGTIIHAVLQEIKSWLNAGGTVNAKRLENTVENSKKNDDKLGKRVLVECSNIATTQLIQNNRNNLANADYEYGLFLPIDNDLMTGKFDILINNENGDKEIWDWKTNKINSGEHKSELINKYELQMKVYAYLIYKLYPLQNTYTCRLLFTRLANNNSPDEEWTHRFDWNADNLTIFEIELKESIKKLREDIFVWC